jgi:hypothetical protein
MKTSWQIFVSMFILIIGCKDKSEVLLTQNNENSVESPSIPHTKISTVNPDSHEGEWLLTNEIFDSLLTFKRIEWSDSFIVYGKKFTFEGDKLKFDNFNPVQTCGNGLLYIDSCAYQMQDKNFTFYFKGGHNLESIFEFQAKYLLEHRDEKNITFSRVEILKDKKTNFYDQY